MADRFDEAAKTLIQQLSIAGEGFNDLRYVEREIAAAMRALVPEGFVVAPKEPTEEMIAAGRYMIKNSDAPSRFDLAAEVYRAEIEARPR